MQVKGTGVKSSGCCEKIEQDQKMKQLVYMYFKA